jgi:hypothetical protein
VNSRIVRSLIKSMNRLKADRTKVGRRKYSTVVESIRDKYMKDHEIRRHCQINWHSWIYASSDEDRVIRSDALSPEVITSIQHFDEDKGTPLPVARTVSAELQPKSVLSVATKVIHQDYLLHPANKGVALSTFRKLTLNHDPVGLQRRETNSLTLPYLNVELKVRALNNKARLSGLPHVFQDKYDVNRSTLCAKVSDFHDLACVDRTCSDCSVEKLREKVTPLADFSGSDVVSWQCWDDNRVTRTAKNGKVVQSSFKVLNVKYGKVEDLLHAGEAFVPFQVAAAAAEQPQG